MSDAKTVYCNGCGAPLNVEMNRAYIFCQYCGAKTVLPSELMRTSINIGDNINISGKTDLDTLVKSAKYAISLKQYDKANDILLSAIISGSDNYEIYICKSMIDLHLDDGKSLFESLRKLRDLEKTQSVNNEVTRAICELMHYRGCNGVTALHNSTFHEQFDMVKFCVEHGADVDLIAGMNMVSPISIMFVPISSNLQNIYGTPFIRNMNLVMQIRDYLLEHGAHDIRRFGR